MDLRDIQSCAVIPASKSCTKCGEMKDLSNYYKQSVAPDGLTYWCKLCIRENTMRNRLKNIDHVNKQKREWYRRNSKKHNAERKVWYDKNKHKESFKRARADYYLRTKDSISVKRSRLKSRYKGHYNLTIEDVELMLAAQGGVCGICDRPERAIRGGKLMSLAVDHDHKTKKNRGMLCVGCNMALGKVERIGLEKFLAYLGKGS